MKHFGDVTKINGASVPLVDVITGGSPCQDLSVAGKRAGLAGERSGLFMEQIRIIKEMRNESIKRLSMRGSIINIRYIQPRYLVWENVCGALDSNGGEDFRTVLEEIVKIIDTNAVVPRFTQRWSPAGCIVANRGGVAWRVHNAEFWGTPQRRKRIALIADFGGQSASEILFERKCVHGDNQAGKEKKTKTAVDHGAIAYSSPNFGGWVRSDVSQTLRASGGDYGGGSETIIMQNGRLRRKTPLECERLQGFPDGWTDIGDWIDSHGKKHNGDSDAPRYRALGNSISIPFWEWLMARIGETLYRDGTTEPTMASLFDGIGGFPLCSIRAGIKPIWASEIEEFPMAVTKYRFGTE